jgi:OFA family oxalate/formate antiporter-like MFS transporter
LPLQKLWSIDATASLLPFIFFFAFFALLMPLAGAPLDKYDPRPLTIIGGIIVGIGWILASQAPNIAFLTLAYGIIGGAGVGIVYNATIGASARWFPDRRGLAVGLTVLGVGISPLITAPLSNYLIVNYGVLASFGILGIAFLILIVVLGLPLRFPDPDWRPEGWTPSQESLQCEDLNRSQMVRTRGFVGLWLGFFIGTLAGLMAVGISSPVGQEVFRLNAATAAALVGVFAVFNGIGRPIFGYLADRIHPRNAAMLSFAITAAVGSVPCGYVAELGSRSRLRAPPLFVAPSTTDRITGLSLPLSGPELLWETFSLGSCGISSEAMSRCSIRSPCWPSQASRSRSS